MEKKSEKNETISLSEAKQALQSVGRRLGLMHLVYAKAIIEELGEEKGIKLISKAIKDYGSKIGEKTKQEVLNKGLDTKPEHFKEAKSYAIPNFPGLHEYKERVNVKGVQRNRAYGCILAKLWEEYGEEKLGRLYCYVDTAKYMAFNPNYKYVHIKALPDGDDCCEFEVKSTTEEERRDFFSDDKDWFYLDK